MDDANVPHPALEAGNRDGVAAKMPGLSPGMVVVAVLMYKTDALLTLQLNEKLQEKHLMECSRVSEAVSRLNDWYRSVAEVQGTRDALIEFFTSKHVHAAEALQQWRIIKKWLAKCEAFAYPLGCYSIDQAELEAARETVIADDEVAEVREAVQVLLAAAQELVDAVQQQ